jgi:flagellar hook-associated protein 3 FlgL
MPNINNSVNDIIKSLPGSSSLRATRLFSDLEGVKKQISEGNKYETRAQLDGAGVGRVYDDLQSKLMFADKYETARNIASYKLQMQQSKLNELSQIKADFAAKKDLIPGQEQEFAQNTLAKIEDVLNSQVDGEYIFGGKNSNIKPVSDLNKQTNVVNGRASTNYTDATSAEIVSPVSEKHSVNLGLISADDPAISSIIAAVNIYKTNNGKGAEVQIDKFLKEGSDSFGKLETKVRIAIKDVEDAKTYNSKIKVDATEQVQNISAGDAVTFAEKAKNIIQSLLANFTLTEVKNKVSDRLFGY